MSEAEERTKRIEAKIAALMARFRMIPEGGRVVVGLSGGADSMALISYLIRTGVPVTAAHVNHCLRGRAAEEDEQFVRDWCGRNRVDLQVLRVDVRARAERSGQGLEECGRAARYEFFNRLAGDRDRIATAHTLSDSAETVLFHLTKGTGLRGLCGIPPVRDRVIRPLLAITREEVEFLCRFYGTPFVTDQTNFETGYERNKLRLAVIPVLKELNPEFEAAVLRMTEALRRDEEYLEDTAEKALLSARENGGYRLSDLKKLAPAVRSRALMHAADPLREKRFAQKHVDALERMVESGTGAVQTPGGTELRAERGFLFVLPPGQKAEKWTRTVEFPETRLPDGRILDIRVISREEYEKSAKFNILLFNNVFDYDTIACNVFARGRRDGDVFRPAGRKVTKTLRKLLNEAEIPPVRRDRLLVLESGGSIAWLEGFGPSEQAAVTGKTQRVAVITLKGE